MSKRSNLDKLLTQTKSIKINRSILYYFICSAFAFDQSNHIDDKCADLKEIYTDTEKLMKLT